MSDLFFLDDGVEKKIEDVVEAEVKINHFSFAKDLTNIKSYLYLENNETLTEDKRYNSFLINKLFSMDESTFQYAQLMNENYILDSKLNHDFYFYGIPKKFVYFKYAKKLQEEDILQYIKKEYNCSTRIAKQYINLLTEDDRKKLVYKYTKGYGGVTK